MGRTGPVKRKYIEIIVAPEHGEGVTIATVEVDTGKRPENVEFGIGFTGLIAVEGEKRTDGKAGVGEFPDGPQDGEGRVVIVDKRPKIYAIFGRGRMVGGRVTTEQGSCLHAPRGTSTAEEHKQ